MHILYLLNDLLHHARYHVDSSSAYSTLSGTLQSYIVDLFGVITTYDREIYPNHHRKIEDLVRLWDENGYYQVSYINKLRETIASSASLGDPEASKPGNGVPQDELIETLTSTSTVKKDVPYIMPASHGDPSTPYYDLPAGNLLPHIIPNSTVSIDPQQVKPLQFVTRPADDNLMRAVKDFMKDIESLDNPMGNDDEGIQVDIDELGQPTIRDEGTGELVRGEGYYGWSKAFCEKMKRRRDGTEVVDETNVRSDSMGRSPSPQERRRYSSSGSSRRSYPSSDSISRSPRLRSRSRSPSRQRPSSYSPPPVLPSSRQQQPIHTTIVPPSLPPPSQPSPPSLPLPFLQDLARGFPLGPDGLPIPPSPPNYKGPWPPPPPPLPQGGGPLPQGNLYPSFPSFVPPPPRAGPGGFSSSGSPPLPHVMTGPQGQMTGNSGGWGPQQHSGYPAYTDQAPYNGYHPGGRGRGPRGGWG